jgi:hypothetical protein
MPYTPPAQVSPEASKTPSPTISRSHSYSKGLLTPETAATRPNLPRSHGSSSYLSRHRRSPSLNDVKELLHNGEAYSANDFDPHGSLRQSPPPQSNSLIPAGMTISPPDSAQNSGDEDEERGRSRDIEADKVKELQLAISGIQQRKSGSPNREEQSPPENGAVAPPNTGTVSANDSRPPLSREARKISHSRSSTDSNISFEPAVEIPSPPTFKPESDEDEDVDEGLQLSRPTMVRKKSGELVRPALRASSRRRPSSMPGTPTYSKAVHFDSHLEHVRHFLQVDRPLAVSAGSSPVENYESESEFPFGSEEAAARSRTSFDWEIKLSNFPPAYEVDARKDWPVHVERIFLSSDNKSMVGSIAVQNLAFHKVVVSRFTFDYWKTTSEVVADFSHDVRRKQDDNLDRFTFSIKLADQVNLENKTMFFCVKYAVNGTEHWDNNGGFNYQVDFSKKVKPASNKNGMPGLGARPLSALPRSRPSPPTSTGRRPSSFPTSFDDFSTGFETFSTSFRDSAEIMGEPKIKLRSPRSKQELVADAPVRRPRSSGNAFGTRYDFNSSLSAAKSTAISVLGEQSGLTPSSGTKQASRDVPVVNGTSSGVASAKPETGAGAKAEVVSKAPAVQPVDKPAALLTEKPPLTSQSYQELVEKYCFVGSRDKAEAIPSKG